MPAIVRRIIGLTTLVGLLVAALATGAVALGGQIASTSAPEPVSARPALPTGLVTNEQDSVPTPAAVGDLDLKALADAPDVTITKVAASPGPGDEVVLARLAAGVEGGTDGWELRATVDLTNHESDTIELIAMTVDTDVTSPEFGALEKPVEIGSGKTKGAHAPQTLTGTGAFPTQLGIKLWFQHYSEPVVVQRSVVEHQSPTHTSGYRFPGKADDLPENTFWSTGGGFHAHTRSQRYAYDLGALKWRDNGWWPIKKGTNGWENDDYYVHGLPVYAVADGTILACRSSVAENVPTGYDNPNGTVGTAGGNGYWIDHGNGEVALYAHLQPGTVPDELCPVESDGTLNATPVQVKAGDYLGDVGNTGSSSAPHLHIHIQDQAPVDWADTGDAEGVPYRFAYSSVRVYDGYTHDGDHDDWDHRHAHEPAALGTSTLIVPNPCGWVQYPQGAAEVSHHGIGEVCWQDVVDAVVEAGYMPEFVDPFTVGGHVFFNGVFGPDDGSIPWALRHGLTADEYQDVFDDLTANGLQPTVVHSYLRGGQVRYNAVFRGGLGVPFAAYHGWSTADHQAKFDELAADGYHPVSVSVVSVSGQPQFTAVYRQEPFGSWVQKADIPLSQYQQEWDDQAAAGRKLQHADVYRHAGQLWVSATFSSAGPSVAGVHGATGQQYQDVFEQQLAQGRLTRLVVGYDDGGIGRYLAAWTHPVVSGKVPGAFTGPSDVREDDSVREADELRRRDDHEATTSDSAPSTGMTRAS